MARLPVSFQSLAIQCAALLAAIFLNYLLQISFSYQAILWQLVLAQAALAAGLSRAWGQPAWWPPLHLGFLPATLLARQAGLPAWVYLVAFVLLLLFYWSTFRTRVPLFLSGRKAWQNLASLLPQTQPFRFIDLGSGLGGVPFYLESRFPDSRLYGTEIAPAPWLISRMRAWFRGSQVNFMRNDYTTLDLARFDVVFAFLSPAAMPALWQQAQAQMCRGTLFISLAFPVTGRQPDHVVEQDAGARHTLYAWRM
ncbi:MAG: class I SAM-dependent methyltransferase [Hydrogenophilales bacterium]|nr:class I SAM-dependent methyltransferase [Hydrogenophilales bacterium]